MTNNSATQISESTVGIITCCMIIIGVLTGPQVKIRGVGVRKENVFGLHFDQNTSKSCFFLFKINAFLFLPLHVSIRLNFNELYINEHVRCRFREPTNLQLLNKKVGSNTFPRPLDRSIWVSA